MKWICIECGAETDSKYLLPILLNTQCPGIPRHNFQEFVDLKFTDKIDQEIAKRRLYDSNRKQA